MSSNNNHCKSCSNERGSGEICNGHSVRGLRRLSNKDRLRTFLQLFKRDDRVLVLIVADPDSMGSAFAIKRLLSRRVTEVVIAYCNQIKRLNNIAMREILKIPMQPLRGTKRDEFTKFILVDSQPTHKKELNNIPFDAVIDHHPLADGWDAPFMDIRPEYGSVCTMMAEYLKSAGIKPSMALATALFYGIKVDTKNFTAKACTQDIRVFQALFKRINQYWLSKIEKSDMRKSELKYFKIALTEMKFKKKRIFAHIGKLSNADVLVLIADFFTHVHEVGWVIISGQVGEKLIIILRCDGYKKDAGKLAQNFLSQYGPAGGHKQSARAELPIKNLPENFRENFNTASLIRLFMQHLK